MAQYCNEDAFLTDENGFRMWEGLVGPYYTPHIDENGNLHWTNNGGLPNPAIVNLLSGGLHAKGIVASASALPADATQGDTYIVGTSYPFYMYFRNNNSWVNIGYCNGPKGDPGGSALQISVPAYSGGSLTVNNARINANMRVVECVWGNPIAISSDISWTTAAGTLTLSGSTVGTTSAQITLIECIS